MRAEPGHDPIEWESAPRPTIQSTPAAQPVHYSTARHGSHVEESPELLRWRADLLMDEMMMGGVDVSAADGNRKFSGVDAPVMQRSQPPTTQPPIPQPPINQAPSTRPTNNGASYREEFLREDSYGAGREQDSQRNSQQDYERRGYGNGHIDRREWESQRNSGPSQTSDNITGGNVTSGNTNSGYTNGTPGSGNYRSVEPERPLGTSSGYPSPSSSEHFTSEHFTNELPRTQEARNFDLRRAEPRDEPRGGGPYPEQPTPTARPYGADNAPGEFQQGGLGHSNGRESGSDSYYGEARYSEPAGSEYSSERNERGISAPRRYPQQQPDQYNEQRPEPYSPDADQSPAQSERRDFERYERYERHDNEAASRRLVTDEPPPPLNPQSGYPPLRTTMDGLPAAGNPVVGNPAGNSEQTSRSDRLYSVEQQYEQFRREQSAHIQPVEPPRSAMRPPLAPVETPRHETPRYEAPRYETPPRVAPRTSQPTDEHTQWATGPDKWEYQDFSADPNAPEEEPLFAGYSAPERRMAQDSGLRHDQGQFVSAMSVVGGSKKRSTLLPRSTELDIDTLHREISDLHGEIAALLPVGNETSERARHLLDKAYSILQSDPSRSAEVEYYMQQVRTIVQRLHQSRQWSDLYRQRLHVYLLGWLGLSAMVLIARFLFQPDLEDALVWVTGVSWDSWLVAHWAAFVGTAGAGAFGGALGALYTMQNHARGEYSFFDRKYGLRGLILPFMGLIVGMLGYAVFGVIFALLGINPSQSLTASMVPTMAAFAFGFSQESIYGTRD